MANPTDNVNGPGVVNGRGAGGFYVSIATTDAWVKVDLGFSSMNQKFAAATANADVSWDHDSLLTAKVKHAQINAGETMDFLKRTTRELFVKSTTPGSPSTLRIYAW